MTVSDDPSRSDLKLWEQALRGDYPIPPAVKRRMLQIAMNLADPVDTDDVVASASANAAEPRAPEGETEGAGEKSPAPSHRTRLAALRVLGQFARLSLEQAKLDFVREQAAQRLADGKPADNVAEVLRDFLSLPADPPTERPATRSHPEAGASVRGDGG